MLEGWLASVLKRVLEAWVEPESLGNLEMSLWSGYAKLTNLRIKRSVLDGLGLPLRLARGHIGQVTVHVPWGVRFGERPAEITVDNVLLLVRTDLEWAGGPREQVDAAALRAKLARVAGWEELVAARRQHSMHMHAAAAAAGGALPPPTPAGAWASQVEASLEAAGAAAPGFAEKLLTALLEGVVLSIRNLHVRWEDGQSLPGHRLSVGITMASLTFASPSVARASAAGKAVSLRGVPLVPSGVGASGGSVMSGGGLRAAQPPSTGRSGALATAVTVASAVAGGVGWGLGVLRQWWQGDGGLEGEPDDDDGGASGGRDGFGFAGEGDGDSDDSGGDGEGDGAAGGGSLVHSQRALRERRRRRRRAGRREGVSHGSGDDARDDDDDDDASGSDTTESTARSSPREGDGRRGGAVVGGAGDSAVVEHTPTQSSGPTLFGFALPWWPTIGSGAAPTSSAGHSVPVEKRRRAGAADTATGNSAAMTTRPRSRLVRKGLHVGKVALYVHVEALSAAGGAAAPGVGSEAPSLSAPNRITLSRPSGGVRTGTLASGAAAPAHAPVPLPSAAVDMAVCSLADFAACMDALIPRDSEASTPPLTCAAAAMELQRLRSLGGHATTASPHTITLDPAATTSPFYRLPSSLQLGDHPARHYFVLAPTDLLVTAVVNRNPRSTSAPQVSLRVAAPVVHLQLLTVQYAAVLAVTAAWSAARVRRQHDWHRPLARVLPPPSRTALAVSAAPEPDAAAAKALRRSLASLWWLYGLRVTMRQLEAGWRGGGLLTWRQVRNAAALRRAFVHLQTRHLLAAHTGAAAGAAPVWSTAQCRTLAAYLSRHDADADAGAPAAVSALPSHARRTGRGGIPNVSAEGARDREAARRRRRPEQPAWLTVRSGSGGAAMGWRKGRGIRHRVDGLFVDDDDEEEEEDGKGDLVGTTVGDGGRRVVRPADVAARPIRPAARMAVSAPPPSSPSSGERGGSSDSTRAGRRRGRSNGAEDPHRSRVPGGGTGPTAASSDPAGAGASERETAVLSRLRLGELVHVVEAVMPADVTQCSWRRWARRWVTLQQRRSRLLGSPPAFPAASSSGAGGEDGRPVHSPPRHHGPDTGTPSTPASREPSGAGDGAPATPASSSAVDGTGAAAAAPPRMTLTPEAQLSAVEEALRRMLIAARLPRSGGGGVTGDAASLLLLPLNEHEATLLTLLQAELGEDALKVLSAVAREQAATFLAPPTGETGGAGGRAVGTATSTSLDSWAASLDDSVELAGVGDGAGAAGGGPADSDMGLALDGADVAPGRGDSSSTASRSTASGGTPPPGQAGDPHRRGAAPRAAGSRQSEYGSWQSGRLSSLVAGSAEALERAHAAGGTGGAPWIDFGWLWQRPSAAAGVVGLPEVVTPATLATASATVTNLLKLDAQWEAKRREMFADLDYDPTAALEPYPKTYIVFATHLHVGAASVTVSNLLSGGHSAETAVTPASRGVHAFQLHAGGLTFSSASRVASARVELVVEHGLATHATFLPRQVIITQLLASEAPILDASAGAGGGGVTSPTPSAGHLPKRDRAHTAAASAASSAGRDDDTARGRLPAAVGPHPTAASERVAAPLGTHAVDAPHATATTATADEALSTRSGRLAGEAASTRSAARSKRRGGAGLLPAGLRGLASPAATVRSVAAGDDGDGETRASGFLFLAVDTLSSEVAKSAADARVGDAVRDTDMTDAEAPASLPAASVGARHAVPPPIVPVGTSDVVDAATPSLAPTPATVLSPASGSLETPTPHSSAPLVDSGRLWVVTRGTSTRTRRRAQPAPPPPATSTRAVAAGFLSPGAAGDAPLPVPHVRRTATTRPHSEWASGGGGGRNTGQPGGAANDASHATPIPHRRGAWAAGADVVLSCLVGPSWLHAAPTSLEALRSTLSIIPPAAATPQGAAVLLRPYTAPASALPAASDTTDVESEHATDGAGLFSGTDGDVVARAQASVQRKLATLGGTWFGHIADALSARRALGLNVRLDVATITLPLAARSSAAFSTQDGAFGTLQVKLQSLRARSDKLQSRWAAATALAALAADASPSVPPHLAHTLFDRFKVRLGPCSVAVLPSGSADASAGGFPVFASSAARGDVSLSIAPTLPMLPRVKLDAALPTCHLTVRPSLLDVAVAGWAAVPPAPARLPPQAAEDAAVAPLPATAPHPPIAEGGTDLSGFEDAVSDGAGPGDASRLHVDVSARHVLRRDRSPAGAPAGPLDAHLLAASLSVGSVVVEYLVQGDAAGNARASAQALSASVHLTTNTVTATGDVGELGITVQRAEHVTRVISVQRAEDGDDDAASALHVSFARHSVWLPATYAAPNALVGAAVTLSPVVLGVPLPQVHTSLTCSVGVVDACLDQSVAAMLPAGPMGGDAPAGSAQAPSVGSAHGLAEAAPMSMAAVVTNTVSAACTWHRVGVVLQPAAALPSVRVMAAAGAVDVQTALLCVVETGALVRGGASHPSAAASRATLRPYTQSVLAPGPADGYASLADLPVTAVRMVVGSPTARLSRGWGGEIPPSSPLVAALRASSGGGSGGDGWATAEGGYSTAAGGMRSPRGGSGQGDGAGGGGTPVSVTAQLLAGRAPLQPPARVAVAGSGSDAPAAASAAWMSYSFSVPVAVPRRSGYGAGRPHTPKSSMLSAAALTAAAVSDLDIGGSASEATRAGSGGSLRAASGPVVAAHSRPRSMGPGAAAVGVDLARRLESAGQSTVSSAAEVAMLHTMVAIPLRHAAPVRSLRMQVAGVQVDVVTGAGSAPVTVMQLHAPASNPAPMVRCAAWQLPVMPLHALTPHRTLLPHDLDAAAGASAPSAPVGAGLVDHCERGGVLALLVADSPPQCDAVTILACDTRHGRVHLTPAVLAAAERVVHGAVASVASRNSATDAAVGLSALAPAPAPRPGPILPTGLVASLHVAQWTVSLPVDDAAAVLQSGAWHIGVRGWRERQYVVQATACSAFFDDDASPAVALSGSALATQSSEDAYHALSADVSLDPTTVRLHAGAVLAAARVARAWSRRPIAVPHHDLPTVDSPARPLRLSLSLPTATLVVGAAIVGRFSGVTVVATTVRNAASPTGPETQSRWQVALARVAVDVITSDGTQRLVNADMHSDVQPPATDEPSALAWQPAVLITHEATFARHDGARVERSRVVLHGLSCGLSAALTTAIAADLASLRAAFAPLLDEADGSDNTLPVPSAPIASTRYVDVEWTHPQVTVLIPWHDGGMASQSLQVHALALQMGHVAAPDNHAPSSQQTAIKVAATGVSATLTHATPAGGVGEQATSLPIVDTVDVAANWDVRPGARSTAAHVETGVMAIHVSPAVVRAMTEAARQFATDAAVSSAQASTASGAEPSLGAAASPTPSRLRAALAVPRLLVTVHADAVDTRGHLLPAPQMGTLQLVVAGLGASVRRAPPTRQLAIRPGTPLPPSAAQGDRDPNAPSFAVSGHGVVSATWHAGVLDMRHHAPPRPLGVVAPVGVSLQCTPAGLPAATPDTTVTLALDRPLVACLSPAVVHAMTAVAHSAALGAAWEPVVGRVVWNASGAALHVAGGDDAAAPPFALPPDAAALWPSLPTGLPSELRVTQLSTGGATPVYAVHGPVGVLWLGAQPEATLSSGQALSAGRAAFASVLSLERPALRAGGAEWDDLRISGADEATMVRHAALLRSHSAVHARVTPAASGVVASPSLLHAAVTGPLVATVLNAALPQPPLPKSHAATWCHGDLGSGVTLHVFTHPCVLFNACDHSATLYAGADTAVTVRAGCTAPVPPSWQTEPWHLRLPELSLATAPPGAAVVDRRPADAGIADCALSAMRRGGWPACLVDAASVMVTWLKLADSGGSAVHLAVAWIPTVLGSTCAVLMAGLRVCNQAGLPLVAAQAVQLHRATTTPPATWFGQAMRALGDDGGVLERLLPLAGCPVPVRGFGEAGTAAATSHALPSWLRTLAGVRPSPDRSPKRPRAPDWAPALMLPAPVLPPGLPPGAVSALAVANRRGRHGRGPVGMAPATAPAAGRPASAGGDDGSVAGGSPGPAAHPPASWYVGPVSLDGALPAGAVNWRSGWSVKVRAAGCHAAHWASLPLTGGTISVPAPRQPFVGGGSSVAADWRPEYRLWCSPVEHGTLRLLPSLWLRNRAPLDRVVCLVVAGVAPLQQLGDAAAGGPVVARSRHGHLASGGDDATVITLRPGAEGAAPHCHVLLLPPGAASPLHAGFLSSAGGGGGPRVHVAVAFAPSMVAAVTALGGGSAGIATVSAHPAAPCVLENVPASSVHRWLASADVGHSPWASWSTVAAVCSQGFSAPTALPFPAVGTPRLSGRLVVGAGEPAAAAVVDVVVDDGGDASAGHHTPLATRTVGCVRVLNSCRHAVTGTWVRSTESAWPGGRAEAGSTDPWATAVPAGHVGWLVGGALCQSTVVQLTIAGQALRFTVPADGEIAKAVGIRCVGHVDERGVQHVHVRDGASGAPPSAGLAGASVITCVTCPLVLLRLVRDASVEPLTSLAMADVAVHIGRRGASHHAPANTVAFAAAAWVNNGRRAVALTLDGGSAGAAAVKRVMDVAASRAAAIEPGAAPAAWEGDAGLVAAAALAAEGIASPAGPPCEVGWTLLGDAHGESGPSPQRIAATVTVARVGVSVPNIATATAAVATFVSPPRTGPEAHVVRGPPLPTVLAFAATSHAVLALQLAADGVVHRIPLPGLRLTAPTPLLPWAPWWMTVLERCSLASAGDLARVAWQGGIALAGSLATTVGLRDDSLQAAFHPVAAHACAALPVSVRWEHLSSAVAGATVTQESPLAGRRAWRMRLQASPEGAAVWGDLPRVIDADRLLQAHARASALEVTLVVAHGCTSAGAAGSVAAIMVPRGLVLRFHHAADWRALVATLPRRLRQPLAVASVVAWSGGGTAAGSSGGDGASRGSE
jgi:hypothetical protein